MKKIIVLIIVALTFVAAIHLTGCDSGGGGNAPIISEIPSDAGGNPPPDGDLDGDGIANSQDDDADGDGALKADDCNDYDADIHPGATEIPSDDVDNDCDGLDESAKDKIWVSDSEGDDTYAGAIDSPVKTITKGIELAMADAASIKDIHVVAGGYVEDVELKSGVNLFGGFSTLASGTRRRDTIFNSTTIMGKDGDKTLTIELTGIVTPPLGYTLFINNSNSTVNGFTIEGDEAGYTIFANNSTATISKCIIIEDVPATKRSISIAVTAMVDKTATSDHTFKITNNSIVMGGNGDQYNDTKNFAVIAAPQIGSERSLRLEAQGNAILNTNDTQTAIGIYAADSENNPNDDPAIDKKSVVDLIAKDNTIDLVGHGGLAVGIAGGVLMGESMLPSEAEIYYLNSLEASGNKMTLKNATNFASGIAAGLVRNPSSIHHNTVSASNAGGIYGIILTNVTADVYNNSFYLNTTGGATVGIMWINLLKADLSIAENYELKLPGKANDNIIYLKACATCPAIGMAEFPLGSGDASPSEVNNNDIYLYPTVMKKMAYFDVQAGTSVSIENVTDLNSKTGFAAGDRTVVSSNISADPLFVDDIDGDLHLQAGSPCNGIGAFAE